MKRNNQYHYMILLSSFIMVLSLVIVFGVQSTVLGWVFGVAGGACAVGFYVMGELNGK